MVRGRKPEPGEPTRGSAISRAFRERKANQLNQLTTENQTLKEENQRFKNENQLLRQLISNNNNNREQAEGITSFSPDSEKDGIPELTQKEKEGELNFSNKRKRSPERTSSLGTFCEACGSSKEFFDSSRAMKSKDGRASSISSSSNSGTSQNHSNSKSKVKKTEITEQSKKDHASSSPSNSSPQFRDNRPIQQVNSLHNSPMLNSRSPYYDPIRHSNPGQIPNPYMPSWLSNPMSHHSNPIHLNSPISSHSPSNTSNNLSHPNYDPEVRSPHNQQPPPSNCSNSNGSKSNCCPPPQPPPPTRREFETLQSRFPDQNQRFGSTLPTPQANAIALPPLPNSNLSIHRTPYYSNPPLPNVGHHSNHRGSLNGNEIQPPYLKSTTPPKSGFASPSFTNPSPSAYPSPPGPRNSPPRSNNDSKNGEVADNVPVSSSRIGDILNPGDLDATKCCYGLFNCDALPAEGQKET